MSTATVLLWGGNYLPLIPPYRLVWVEDAAPFPRCANALTLSKVFQGPPLPTGLRPSGLVSKALDAFLRTSMHETFTLILPVLLFP